MRLLHDYEKPLVSALFRAAGLGMPENLRAARMDDGGMGSLSFLPDNPIARFGVAVRYLLDEDGVVVTAALNTTIDGKPVELDIWKVDFSPLRRWPEESEILEQPPGKGL